MTNTHMQTHTQHITYTLHSSPFNTVSHAYALNLIYNGWILKDNPINQANQEVYHGR